ncbi:unnamed protein product, partial [Rotaria magnacalcarata]
MTWSRDGQSLYLEIGEEANNVIYYLSNIFTDRSINLLIRNGTSHNVNVHPIDNLTFVFTHDSILEPANIYLYLSNGSSRSLTDHNKVLLAKVKMSNVAEKFSFSGYQNETVWGWHVPPANGTNSSAPLAFLIHGGPQSSWYDAWSYRWNFQSFSSQGYAVIAINFHGSDSYGQNFTDSIIGEYGSLPYEDLKLGLSYALNKFPYINASRAAALGASYGGFMVNWIAGHPEMSVRFKTLICHNGALDTRSKSYSTDELWFNEHDVGNYTPWDNPAVYEEFNPVNHVANSSFQNNEIVTCLRLPSQLIDPYQFLAPTSIGRALTLHMIHVRIENIRSIRINSNWTQPMLIIVGAHDYRIPETQGIGTFTALQRRGIPSR